MKASYKYHGRWVRHKELDFVGRIAFHYPRTRRIAVIWEAGKYGPHNLKTPAGGEYNEDQLAFMPYEPEPWFRLDKANDHRLLLDSERRTERQKGDGIVADDDLDFDELEDLDEEEETRAAAKKSTKKAAKPKGIGAGQVADKLGTTGKTFRAWLRRAVAAGEVKLKAREGRERYSWASWKDPELVQIMKAWTEADHTKGGGKKGKKPAAKKTTAKKSTSKPRAKASAKK